MRDGDLLEGELEIGQVSALLKDWPATAALMENLVDDFRALGTVKMAPGFSWDALL